jgi:hypothetical protein
MHELLILGCDRVDRDFRFCVAQSQPDLESEPWSATLSTMIAFVAVYGLIANLLRMIIRFIYRPNRAAFQRIWGAALGMIRGILAAGIFAFLITRFFAPQKPNWEKEKSLLVEPVSAVAPAVYSAFVAVFPRSGPVFSRMGEGFVDGADRIRDRIHPSPKDE